MIPIGICTDFSNLPEARALGYDFAEVPLDRLSALWAKDETPVARRAARMQAVKWR